MDGMDSDEVPMIFAGILDMDTSVDNTDSIIPITLFLMDAIVDDDVKIEINVFVLDVTKEKEMDAASIPFPMYFVMADIDSDIELRYFAVNIAMYDIVSEVNDIIFSIVRINTAIHDETPLIVA